MVTKTTPAPARQPEAIPPFAGAVGAKFIESVLPMSQRLDIGATIVSANGIFFAMLEADGQLRVYRGAPGRPQGVLWESGRSGDGGRFFALVQTDGNFCIYRGHDLSSNEGWHWGTQMTADGGRFHALLADDGTLAVCTGSEPGCEPDRVWSSGVADPIARIDQVQDITYDLERAVLVQARPSDLYRETVNNDHSQARTSLINGSVTVSDTSGWSDQLAAGTGEQTNFKGMVPVVSGGKVSMSAEAARVFIRNGAATTARTWGFNAPATVPANASIMCLVGKFTLKSGAQLEGTASGTYRGANCHDLTITMTTFDQGLAGSSTVSRQLAPMPSISGPATPHPLGASAFY